jgi:hypothetical protein
MHREYGPVLAEVAAPTRGVTMRGLIVAIAFCGGLGSYFVASGISALRKGRITVVNPESRAAWPGLVGAVLWHLRSSPRLMPSTERYVDATGAEARERGVLHLVLGLAFFVVLGLAVAMSP